MSELSKFEGLVMAKAKELPQSIKDYSEKNPLASAGEMRRFEAGRNIGLEEAATLIEGSADHSEPELAAKIRALLFVNE